MVTSAENIVKHTVTISNILTFSGRTTVVHIEHGHFIKVADSFDVIIFKG